MLKQKMYLIILLNTPLYSINSANKKTQKIKNVKKVSTLCSLMLDRTELLILILLPFITLQYHFAL